MITIFTCPKPFDGHINIIQRHAIKSWMRIKPRPEIILFGNEPGIPGAAIEFGCVHNPTLAYSLSGVPLVNSIFEKAEASARGDVLAYVNADIILLPEFGGIVEQVAAEFEQLLMIGQRWDIDIQREIDFSDSHWATKLHLDVARRGTLHQPWGIDYFIFRRGLWEEIPPFRLGRKAWDNWLVRAALNKGAWSFYCPHCDLLSKESRCSSCERSLEERPLPVIDATQMILAFHQNHGKGHYAGGTLNPDVRENYRLMGTTPLAGVQHATRKLVRRGA